MYGVNVVHMLMQYLLHMNKQEENTMHKMLKDYLENYTDFGNREKELEKNEEYVEIEKNIDKLKKDYRI